jgi:hypothetical protein
MIEITNKRNSSKADRYKYLIKEQTISHKFISIPSQGKKRYISAKARKHTQQGFQLEDPTGVAVDRLSKSRLEYQKKR